MKEIKVRAYDKSTQTMIYSDKDTLTYGRVYFFEMGIKGTLKCFWREVYDKFCYPAINVGELDNIMQYTGLKDKNGKEIYDGDVVEVHSYCLYHSYKSNKFIVNKSFRTWLDGEEFGYEGEKLINPEDTTVIGNIYENKELLNDESVD